MAKKDPYQATPADKFTFGLWTVGNPGRDPFGEATRAKLDPAQIVGLLDKAGGVYGVNFHDNDLIPIDATEAEAKLIKKDFRRALKRTGIKVAMATTNLFSDPVFKDGAFTSNDADVRAYAVQKTMNAMALGAEFGAKVYVFWGGREGTDTDAAKDPVLAIKRMRESLNFLCKHSIAQKYNYKFAMEAKPNEPRGHIYNAVTGSYLAFIQTLDHPEMVGVNPEFAHEQMAGLNFTHQVAAALECGKLFHIDLNDQDSGRYDQDFRFASVNYKAAFFLVKTLIDYKYKGFKHFDSHAYRTSDYNDVVEFARGSMRSYKVLESKVEKFYKDRKIQSLLRKIDRTSNVSKLTAKYSKANAKKLLAEPLNRQKLAGRPLPYEELDQRVFDLLMGV